MKPRLWLLCLIAFSALPSFADEASTLSYTLEADGILHLSWPLAGSSFRLQSKGDIGTPDWTDLPATYATNRFHVFEPMTQPAQFYRLIRDCDAATHVWVPIAFFQYNANDPTPLPVNLANSSFPQVQAYGIVFANNRELTLDFSQAFNPLSCSTNGLTYHYSIEYTSPEIPNPYRVAGITGYDTPVLHIKANSLVSTINPGTMTVVMIVTNELEPDPDKRQVRCQVTGIVTGSAITVSQFNICQMGADGCTNPNLLPVAP